MNNSASAGADGPVVDKELPPAQGLRWVAAFLGLAVLAVGGVATFRSTNGAGSAALVVAGVALLILGGLGDRIEHLKFGNVEIQVRAAAHLIRRADQLELQGDTEAADQLRGEAERLLLQASPAARRYEELRRARPPGPERTAAFYDVVEAARQFSREQHPSAEFVRDMFKRGQDGDRVYALVLMEEDPRTGDLASVVNAISRSNSAFEQYRALAAAVKMAPQLEGSDLGQLADVIRQQMGPGGHVTPSTDRYGLARKILSMTDPGKPRQP